MAIAAIGVLMGAAGNIMARNDQADAERHNADELQRQGRLQEQINARKLQLLQQNQEKFNSGKASMFAKAGISLSGSVLSNIANDKAQQATELNYASIDNREKANAYYTEANRHATAAKSLSDPLNMFLTTGGSVLTGYAGSSSMRGSGGSSGAPAAQGASINNYYAKVPQSAGE